MNIMNKMQDMPFNRFKIKNFNLTLFNFYAVNSRSPLRPICRGGTSFRVKHKNKLRGDNRVY